MSKKFLIIDDHNLFAEAFELMIKFSLNYSCVGIISTLAQLKECLKNEVDLVFLDINMPDFSGIDAIPVIKNMQANTKILIVSMVNNPLVILKALDAGANGYISKNTNGDEIELAIKTIFNNGVYIPQDMKLLVEQLDQKHGSGFEQRNVDEKLNSLSKREHQILKLIAFGYTNKEIAEQLFLSELTTKTHRTNILRKLGLKNSSALTHFAHQIGWL